MSRLRIVAGEETGREYELGDKVVSIGRRSESNIVIDHPKASRDHAQIKKTGESFVLTDLGSSNGTYMNGLRISGSHHLVPGDEIRIGGSVLRFFVNDRSASSIKIVGYSVKDILAEGGMGSVYKALQVSMDRYVALKILHKKYADKKEWVQRFVQEARLAGKLNHPNIISVHDVGKAGATYYFTMELVEGNDLSQIMACRTLEYPEVMRIGARIADALDYAHRNSLIHRDIKPENIMLSRDGEVKLADLGIAKSFEAEGSITNTELEKKVLGTPHYMSPEQASGQELDGRSDLYSLGATLYNILAEKPPFTGDNNQVIMVKHLTDEPEPLSEINPRLPKAVIDVVARLMQKKPGDRYESAAQARDALEAAAKARPRPGTTNRKKGRPTVSSRPLKALKSKQKQGLKNEMLVKAGIFVFVLVIALLLISKFGGDKEAEVGNQGAAANEMMAAADGLAQKGKFEQAIGKYQEVRDKYSADLDLQKSVSEEIRTLRMKITAMKQRAEIESKWAAYLRWETAHREETDEIENKLVAMIKQEPGLSSRARKKLVSLRAVKKEIVAKEMTKRLVSARAKGQAALFSLNIDEAAEELLSFLKDYPEAKQNDEVKELLANLHAAVEKKYSEVDRTAKQYLENQRFSQAIASYERFMSRVKAKDFTAKAEGEIKNIKSSLKTMNDEVTTSVQSAVRVLDFEQALQQLSRVSLAFVGTDFAEKHKKRVAAIRALQKYHLSVLAAIKSAGSKTTKIKVAAYFEGQKPLRILSVSGKGLTVPLSGGATTMLSWKQLAPVEILKIYQLYTDSSNSRGQKMLKLYSALFKLN